MPAPPRRAPAVMRPPAPMPARAPSPMPPIPQPPPSVDLGVELPVVGPGLMDDDFPETGDLEVQLPTVRPAPAPASSRPFQADDDATFHAGAALHEEPREEEATFHAGSSLHQEPREDDATFHADEAPDASDDDEDSALAEDEALAERLSDRLRGNPRDRATVLALADVLDRLGRDLELFALLSARMDEGDDDERRALAPARRAVLARLADRARAAGNGSEAELYEMMLAGGE